MSVAHTPGPWEIREDTDSHVFHIVRPWDAVVLPPARATTFGSYLGADICEVCYAAAGVATREQAEANARLMAAAPDLLAACEAEMALYDGMDADAFAPATAARIRAMRAAIAKARGEAPDA